MREIFFSEPGVLYWTNVYFSWCFCILERKYPTHPFKNTFTSLFMNTRMKENILCGFNKINIFQCVYEYLKHRVQVIFHFNQPPKNWSLFFLKSQYPQAQSSGLTAFHEILKLFWKKLALLYIRLFTVLDSWCLYKVVFVILSSPVHFSIIKIF